MLFIGEWACIGLLLLYMGRMRTVKLHQRIQGMGILHPRKRPTKKSRQKTRWWSSAALSRASTALLRPLYWISSCISPRNGPISCEVNCICSHWHSFSILGWETRHTQCWELEGCLPAGCWAGPGKDRKKGWEGSSRQQLEGTDICLLG